MEDIKVLRVSKESDPGKVAGAIVKGAKESGVIRLQAIGASAVNQSVKSLIIARSYLADENPVKDIRIVPGFAEVVLQGETKTSVIFTCTLED